LLEGLVVYLFWWFPEERGGKCAEVEERIYIVL